MRDAHTIWLPALVGRRDEQAEADLERKRVEALAWMGRKGIFYLGHPVPPIDPLPAKRVVWLRQPTEGIR